MAVSDTEQAFGNPVKLGMKAILDNLPLIVLNIIFHTSFFRLLLINSHNMDAVSFFRPKRSKPGITRSASLRVVSSPTPTQYIPQFLAASTPAMASSKTTQVVGSYRRASAPFKRTSGSGLAFETLFPSMTTSNRSSIFS